MTSFTAVFYEFVQLSQVILPSASGTLPLSASLGCGGLILHGGLLKQTQSLLATEARCRSVIIGFEY